MITYTSPLPNTCLHSHAKHGILLGVILPWINAEQRSKVVFVYSLLILVDPISPLSLGFLAFEVVLIQVLNIDLGECFSEIFVDFIVNALERLRSV
jgi:hypothetical protein